MIRWGRLVLVIGGQKSQTSSWNHQAQVHTDQMVLVMARQESVSTEAKLKGYVLWWLSNESWKPTLGSQETELKKAEWQPKQESTYSFLWGLMKRHCCWWRWWWWVRTNQAFHRFMPQRFWVLTKPCLELNLYRRTHCYKWAGGWLSPYTKSCDGGGKGWSTRTDNRSQFGFTPLSMIFMHLTGLTRTYRISQYYFVSREDEYSQVFYFPGDTRTGIVQQG